MRHALWIAVGVVFVIALVMVGLIGGWALWGEGVWTRSRYAAAGNAPDACGGGRYQMGPGMMGRSSGWGTQCEDVDYESWTEGIRPEEMDRTLTIEQAREATEQFVAGIGLGDLVIAELMEFEHNFYAIVEEPHSGIGAMELLIDKWSGAVTPEMGPNMMWNARYGMHGRGTMMGWTASETNSVSAEEALSIAQNWLDEYRPGVTVEDHADPFYGYYTIHTMYDGGIEGMLSVHGTTGQVWYHTWHGSFVQMIEEEQDH